MTPAVFRQLFGFLAVESSAHVVGHPHPDLEIYLLHFAPCGAPRAGSQEAVGGVDAEVPASGNVFGSGAG